MMPPALNAMQGQNQMQNMGSMPQGMDQIQDMEQEPEKIVAHFSLDEFPDLNEMQGGEVFDPETGLRDYRPLESIVKIPEIHDAILSSMRGTKQKFAMGGEVEEQGRPQDPELEQLRLQGRHGDTELAIISPYLLEFFSEMAAHEPQENPETGLPEFFSFKNFFRSAVRVVGTLLGPIGGFAASKLTGQSTGAALKNAFIGAALPMAAMGIPYVASAMGLGGAGGAAGGAGGASGILGNLFGGSAGGAGGTGGGLVSNLSGVGTMLPGAGQMAAQAAQAGLQGGAPGGMPTAAGQQGGGILGSLLGGVGKALPLVGAGLMLNKGRQEENKQIKDYEKERRAENEAERERYGFNEPLRKRQPQNLEATNTPISREDYESGSIPRFFRASGGAIRGEGKGQQDNIKKDIKENSYIIDASTVSDLGDGSSQAGIKELDNYFSKISPMQSQSNRRENKAQGGYIKAMVSNDEYEVDPSIVTSIGRGSNEKGAKILEKFIKEVRSKKRTSGEKLPPKSKPIGGYLKQISG
jgi:hypothetical protein